APSTFVVAGARAWGPARPPRRIEVYDNSHVMGTSAVGAMIVAGAEGFMKTHYRTFNIKSQDMTPGDDYAMIREVLRRRFARLLKDQEGGAAPRAPCDADVAPGSGITDAALEAGFSGPPHPTLISGRDRPIAGPPDAP